MCGGALGLGAAVYLRPMWFVTALRRNKLRRAGVESRYATVKTSRGGFRVHYVVGGEGPTVVLVHGMNGSVEYWADLLPKIVEAGFRVYAVDLLGFGRSEAPDVDYAIRLQAEIVRELLQQLELRAVRLLGVSLGGWIALRVAAEEPELVRALLLLNSAGMSLETEVNMELFSPESVSDLQQLLAVLMTVPPQVPRFLARDLVRSLRRHGWVVRRTIRSIFTAQDVLSQAELEAVRAQTTLIWGAEDRLIPLIEAEQLQRSIAGAELQVIPGCGHAILEMRGDEVTRRILESLDRTR